MVSLNGIIEWYHRMTNPEKPCLTFTLNVYLTKNYVIEKAFEKLDFNQT
jgi:hypothetical protein